MSEIPNDILEAARSIVKAPIADDDGNCLAYFAGSYTTKAVHVLAHAILAERERCAMVAEEVGRGASRNREVYIMTGVAGLSRVIASAIRMPADAALSQASSGEK